MKYLLAWVRKLYFNRRRRWAETEQDGGVYAAQRGCKQLGTMRAQRFPPTTPFTFSQNT